MLDIAVIGGGVAGCYCACRLAESDGRSVGLFEVVSPIARPYAEIGGMLFRENHRKRAQTR